MQRYEQMYICDPSSDEGIEDVKKRIEGIITGREGSVVSFEKLGKKRLAYPIQKRQFGVYQLVNFDGDGRIVQALEYFMRLNPIVIRYLIIRFSEKQLSLRDLTTKIQAEEAERMRRGGRPISSPENESKIVAESAKEKVKEDETTDVEQSVVELKLDDDTELGNSETEAQKTETSEEHVDEAETASEDIDETNDKHVE